MDTVCGGQDSRKYQIMVFVAAFKFSNELSLT
jgi:hypothetical protein